MSEPIRILHVVTYMGRGGLETMIMNYYRHIDRSKVQFDFLVHRDFRADYDDEIEALGGKIYRLPRLVPWSKSYRTALDTFFDEHPGYRIVHVHQDCLSSVILMAAKKHGVPVRIAHSHNSNQDRNLKYLIKLYYRRLIPCYATDLFACGRQAGQWMFMGKPFQIVNNAIDAGLYTFDAETAERMRSALGIDRDTLVVGHVGRFAAAKNHSFLLDIFRELYAKYPDSKLLLVGDGDLRDAMEEKAMQLGIRDRVIFTGIRSDVVDLMQAMDVFVFPSVYEGLPVTLVEAQAAGLPCIVSENIPPECKITSLVEQIPLENSPEYWAEQILAHVCDMRGNTYAQIAAAGFDISENVRWLQNEYLTKWKACD